MGDVLAWTGLIAVWVCAGLLGGAAAAVGWHLATRLLRPRPRVDLTVDESAFLKALGRIRIQDLPR